MGGLYITLEYDGACLILYMVTWGYSAKNVEVDFKYYNIGNSAMDK